METFCQSELASWRLHRELVAGKVSQDRAGGGDGAGAAVVCGGGESAAGIDHGDLLVMSAYSPPTRIPSGSNPGAEEAEDPNPGGPCPYCPANVRHSSSRSAAPPRPPPAAAEYPSGRPFLSFSAPAHIHTSR